MADAPATALATARPTIRLAGRENESLAAGMLGLRVEETVGGISHCELSVGNNGPGWLTVMPNRIVILNAGGVRASGMLAEGDAIVQHEVRETRLFKTLGNDGQPSYECQIIMSSDAGRTVGAEDPVDPERVLEPEDL